MARTRDDEFWLAFKEHSRRSHRAAEILVEMLENLDRAQELAQQISDLEHEGDRITHDIVHALHQTWITPLDREEIHGLISRLDDVLDFIEAASERVALYEIKTVRAEAIDIAKVLARSCRDIQKAMDLLQNLKDAQPVLDLCMHINRHEHEADQIFRRALARLFNDKERNDPLEVMKWRDILEAIETATDRCEDVANIVEGIVLEHA
jgi:predicted phosphate transport protein (TIGR00153 family)